ncbi:MAG: hypothetical protein AAB669_01725 [Patescibacteria group bacterium]
MEVFVIIASLSSILSLLLTVWLYLRARVDMLAVLREIRLVKDDLSVARKEYKQFLAEFQQFQGLRFYLRQAMELYVSARKRVVSVARVWWVSSEMEEAMSAILRNGVESDFCGPVALDAMFPHLLWRLHFMYVRNAPNPGKIRFWAIQDLPIRFSVSDDRVLIAGAPPSGSREETVGWQYWDPDPAGAAFYVGVFDKWREGRNEAEVVLIALLKSYCGAAGTLQSVVDRLTAETYKRAYELSSGGAGLWGPKMQKVDFERLLEEWFTSLPKRHPALVSCDAGQIEFL